MASSSRAVPHRKFAHVGGYGQLPVIPTQFGETDYEEGAVRKMSTSRCISDISPVSPPEPSFDNFGFPALVPLRHSNGSQSDGRFRRISPARMQDPENQSSLQYANKTGTIISMHSLRTTTDNIKERKQSSSTSQGTRIRKTSLSSTQSDSTLYSVQSKQSSRRKYSNNETTNEKQQNGGNSPLSQNIPRIVLSRRVARNFRQRVHQQIVDRKGRGILTFVDRPQHGRESVGLQSVNIEPTYQMEPVNKFNLYYHRILSMLDERVRVFLQGESYNCRKSSKQAQLLAARIKEEVKGIGLDRYKIITMVTIGENKHQSLQVSSRAIWDTLNDSFVSTSFQNASLFCVAKVFAVYCE